MVQSKLTNNSIHLFSFMNKLIEEKKVIDLVSGSTSQNCSKQLLEMASKHLTLGFNNYAPVEGVPELRAAISERVEEVYGYSYNPDKEVTITVSSMQAIYTAITAFVKDEDEVIIFEPYSEFFVPSILLNNGKPVYAQMKAPDFKIEWEDVRKLVTSKTRLIIIESPHNPTGRIMTDNDYAQLQRLTAGTNIIILSCEVNQSILFGENTFSSISQHKKLHDRSLVISSSEALYNTSNWGLAYCLGSEEIMSEFRKLHYYQVHHVNTPLQYVLADFLNSEFPINEISELFRGKRNYFNRLLEGSMYKVLPAQGGVYEFIDYSRVSSEPDITFAERLATEYGVATIPASAFYHEENKYKYLRVCFYQSNENLEQAAERMLKVTPA